MIPSIRRIMSLPFAISILAWVSACATGADPSRMVITPSSPDSNFPEQLRHAMCVRQVAGGEDTNPLWVSKVGNDDFRSALAASMGAVGLIGASDACKYPVDVNLLGLSQPTLGFSMEVTSHINYKVFDPAGQPVLLETISAAYTAAVSESLIGMVRLKRANEGSIRTSITMFLDKLRAVKLT